jgi:uncharacterized surface protein with fasciclin (FAS1) repeats
MLQETDAQEETSAAADATTANTTDTVACKTMLEIIQSRDDLSMLRELLDDIPAVAATLAAKNFTDNMKPLRLENGGYFTDTLFAPNDDAILALLRHVSSDNQVDSSTGEPASVLAQRKRAMRELLGKGNASVATNFVAYHVVPNRRLALPDLEVGELLTTALGGPWRLMVDRMKPGAMNESAPEGDANTNDGDNSKDEGAPPGT